MKDFFGKLLLIWLFTAVFVSPPLAKNTVDARTFVVSSSEYASMDYAAISKELDTMRENLKSNAISNSDMKKYVSTLGNIRSQAAENKKQLEEELRNINRRIESLGVQPESGEELPQIAEKRKEYNEEAIFQKGRIAENDILIAKADEITSLILVVRKQAMINSLLVYQDPLIYPANLFRATAQFLDFGFDIVKSPLTWYNELSAEQKSDVRSNIIIVIVWIVFFCSIGVFLRLMIKKYLGYRKEIESPTYMRKFLAAFFVACAYGIIPAVLLGSFLVWIYQTEILNIGLFSLVLSSTILYTLFILLANSAIRVVFAPYNPKWRLINIDDNKAKSLTKTFYFAFTIIGLANLLQHIASEANYSIELLYFLSFISTSVKVFSIILIIKRFLWEDIANEIFDKEDNADAESEASLHTNFVLRILFLTVLFGSVVVAMSLFGYPRLASFIVNRFIASVIFITIMIMLHKALFESIRRLLLFNFWVRKLRVRKQLIDKVDFWLGLIINPTFILFAILVLLSMWGVSTDLLLQSAKKLFLGFNIGGFEISLLAIFFGIITFFVCINIVRMLRRKLFDGVLSHLEVEEGIKIGRAHV